MLPHSGLLRFYIAGKFPMFIVWVNERNVKKKGARDSFYFGTGRESTFIVVADFAREQPVAFKACLLRAQRRFHATGYTRAGRVDARATHGCRAVRAKAGACCRILPARGLWRAHLVVPPCRAPVSRAAYFTDIPFPVRRVPSKAMPVTGFGNTTKKRSGLSSAPSRNKTNPAPPFFLTFLSLTHTINIGNFPAI